ncbi:MAG TPA: cytochrome c oxidase subunit II [Vicinamibacterales bacterium]|nr:cytochrome c oxidase subunit II [Vicinamibacterales bacterium]
MFSGIPLFPQQASTLAADVDALYLFIIAVTAFFGILTTVVVIYFAAKYRTDDPMKVGARIHGSIPLELAWSIIPFLISIVIFGWAAKVYFDLYRPPDQALEIYATGKRWMWKFQHLDGQNEINELHVPLGRPVKVTFTSEDVLHSLFFPAFRTKADAIPGRYSSVWFTPTIVGEHHLFCAEYCGTNHSGMIGKVIVMEPTAYEAWLSGNVAGTSLAQRGQRLFSDLACNTCHLEDGRGRGPALTNKFGFSERLADGTTVPIDEAYLRESILRPQAKVVDGYQPLMPTFQGLVSEENVMALVEYVKSLRPQTGAVSRVESHEETASPAAPQENR